MGINYRLTLSFLWFRTHALLRTKTHKHTAHTTAESLSAHGHHARGHAAVMLLDGRRPVRARIAHDCCAAADAAAATATDSDATNSYVTAAGATDVDR